MAVAGCINAYDCSGTLIRTLEQLQSSNIGVGVQYTAPNPLDDKKIDYIKYTDKCGCTCCLSAENEILIYATNGVIKNLTLTNDDVNEAIKIKWNDIFGSNRAKTIVRYKTGSYPVSITDGTLAVEETTKNQYSSTAFSLTGVLDETTYYITAFAVDSNNTVISSQTASVTTDFGWKPGTDTLAYWKLDGNLNDSSGNNRNLTNAGQLTFATVDGVQCASCNGDVYGTGYAYCQSLPTPTIITVNMRAKATNNRSGEYARGLFHTHFNYNGGNDGVRREMYSGNGFPYVMVGNGQYWNDAKYDGVPYSALTSRNLRTVVRNNSTHQLKIYRNSVLYNTKTFSSYIPSGNWNSYFTIGTGFRPNDPNNRKRYGRISETIVEQKERTQEELTSYFNKMKSKYGL